MDRNDQTVTANEAEPFARARAACERAERLCHTSADVCAHTMQVLGHSLTAATDAVDHPGGSSTMQRRERRLAALVGRDPAIDVAKTLLMERYMITGPEAFAILRKASQRTNTKLSIVAQNVLRAYRE